MEKKTIGAFIAALRKANGLTQKQLADKLCVSDKAVSRWERDETLPDLTLIPVMAELFGVTSDELLRGQRANPDATPTPQAEEKSQKRLQYLLDKAKTNFQIRCIIAVMLALAGLIMAMILNLACLRAYAGFLCGSVFFLTAAVYLVISYIQAKTNLRSEDFDPQLLQGCTRSICKMLELTLSVVAIIFAFTFPLLVVGDAYAGLNFGSWLLLGIPCSAIAAALCSIVCYIIKRRLGIRGPLSQKARLRLLTIAILIPVLGVTWLGHYFGTELLYQYRYLLAGHERYDNQEDLQKFTETLEVWAVRENGTVYIDPNDGTIYSTLYNGKAVYSFSKEQEDAAIHRCQIITKSLFVVYPMEVAAVILIYRKKARALPASA